MPSLNLFLTCFVWVWFTHFQKEISWGCCKHCDVNQSAQVYLCKNIAIIMETLDQNLLYLQITILRNAVS